MEQLAEHTYFLLPLVFESTMPPTSKFVAGNFDRVRDAGTVIVTERDTGQEDGTKKSSNPCNLPPFALVMCFLLRFPLRVCCQPDATVYIYVGIIYI